MKKAAFFTGILVGTYLIFLTACQENDSNTVFPPVSDFSSTSVFSETDCTDSCSSYENSSSTTTIPAGIYRYQAEQQTNNFDFLTQFTELPVE